MDDLSMRENHTSVLESVRWVCLCAQSYTNYS